MSIYRTRYLSFLVFVFLFLHAEKSWAQKAELEFELHEGIVFKEFEETSLSLDAYIPEGKTKYPAVLVIFGGAWRQGNRKQLSSYAEDLAKRGFCCFAIEYRLAPKHKFPAQIEDCRAALQWVRQNTERYKVNPDRIGAIGYSSGGHLASLLGTTGEAPSEENGNIESRIQAVVAGGAPTDFRWSPDNGEWARYWMGGNLEEVPEKFEQASPAAFIDKDDPPFFFFHGKDDIVAPMILPFTCHLALKKAGVQSEMFGISDADHVEAAFDEEALAAAYRFLEEQLGEPK